MSRIQTTQATAKRWKALQALGALAMMFGLGWVIFARVEGIQSGHGPALLGWGFGVYLIARILAWWNHG